MKILLSPAKSMNEQLSISGHHFSNPELLDYSKKLIDKLKKLNPDEIQQLMNVSPAIAELNYSRFQNWKMPFNNENSLPCAWVFSGAAYKGLDFDSLSESTVSYSQKTLRILSGLYGVLRPLDLIQPYRLEMGTKLNMNSDTPTLYKFWGDKITDLLNLEINENEWVVNLASNEYFKSINTKKLNGKLVNCVFKENKNGAYKIVMSYAKTARGLMTRYVLENSITEKEDLLGFNSNGYKFYSELSSENEFVFVR